MERQLEPELMEDPAQVKAYAEADFEIPHSQFIDRLKTFINQPGFNGTALDLGCGPGDISRRFARAFPLSRIDAVDGSLPMIACANLLSDAPKTRLNFIHGLLPDVDLPESGYDIIFSNSLLHHLPDPQVLWRFINRYTRPGTRIVIMDLLRPESLDQTRAFVNRYAGAEPEILQRDFYHSLLAAFSIEEIRSQLEQAGLKLDIEQTSDRHVFIKGIAD